MVVDQCSRFFPKRCHYYKLAMLPHMSQSTHCELHSGSCRSHEVITLDEASLE